MRKSYEDIPSNQIEKQKKHLYGSMINILYLKDNNSPYIDATIQNLINEVRGLNAFFGYQAEIMSIVANLTTARENSTQFRACILTAANLVDRLGGELDV